MFTERDFLELDARREESGEAHNECQGAIISISMTWCT